MRSLIRNLFSDLCGRSIPCLHVLLFFCPEVYRTMFFVHRENKMSLTNVTPKKVLTYKYISGKYYIFKNGLSVGVTQDHRRCHRLLFHQPQKVTKHSKLSPAFQQSRKSTRQKVENQSSKQAYIIFVHERSYDLF